MVRYAPQGRDGVSSRSGEACCRVRGVTKRFGGITANRDITFEVAAGELVGIIGPNGAGKSTLFECISGFYAPDEGEVELDGARLTGLRRTSSAAAGIARTFQKLRPFQGMTVAENVMVGALAAHPRREACARAGARRLRRGRASPRRRTPMRARSRPGSASASSSPARSRPGRGCCSSTK